MNGSGLMHQATGQIRPITVVGKFDQSEQQDCLTTVILGVLTRQTTLTLGGMMRQTTSVFWQIIAALH